MLDQVFQQAVRQTVLVCPCAITEYALQFVGVGILDSAERLYDSRADILGDRTDILPMRALWHIEAMVFLPFECFFIAVVLL